VGHKSGCQPPGSAKALPMDAIFQHQLPDEPATIKCFPREVMNAHIF